MRRSASILASAALAVGAVLAACSSGPEGEETGSSVSQDLYADHCPVGQVSTCTKGPDGALVCKCGPAPLACVSITPSPLPSGYIAAWATTPRSGSCGDIVVAGKGTWANVGTTPPGFSPLPAGSDGVPNDGEGTPPSCTDVFPSSTCCTYVWWPNGFPDGANQAKQDNTVICGADTASVEAIYEGDPSCNEPDGGHKCKGGDDCPTCTGAGAPIDALQ
jgi:hypothetical protein